jgi:hypothetical protein
MGNREPPYISAYIVSCAVFCLLNLCGYIFGQNFNNFDTVVDEGTPAGCCTCT